MSDLVTDLHRAAALVLDLIAEASSGDGRAPGLTLPPLGAGHDLALSAALGVAVRSGWVTAATERGQVAYGLTEAGWRHWSRKDGQP